MAYTLARNSDSVICCQACDYRLDVASGVRQSYHRKPIKAGRTMDVTNLCEAPKTIRQSVRPNSEACPTKTPKAQPTPPPRDNIAKNDSSGFKSLGFQRPLWHSQCRPPECIYRAPHALSQRG